MIIRLFAVIGLLCSATTAGCSDHAIGLPDDPYLYSCIKDDKVLLFDLKHLSGPVDAGDAVNVVQWVGSGDYLQVTSGEFVDVMTMERFTVPSGPDGCFIAALLDGHRFMRACIDDPLLNWRYSTVDRSGVELQDHGLALGIGSGALSPDHQQVFGLMRQLPGGGFWVQDLSGGVARRLDACSEKLVDPAPLYFYEWMSDSQHLVVFTPPSEGHWSEDRFHRCNINDDTVEILGAIHSPVEGFAFTLDHSRVAYTRAWNEPDPQGLYVIDFATGETTMVDHADHFRAFDWTRDGKHLLVELDDGSPQGSGPKYLLSYPEGRKVPLSQPFPCWFPKPCPLPLSVADVGSLAP